MAIAVAHKLSLSFSLSLSLVHANINAQTRIHIQAGIHECIRLLIAYWRTELIVTVLWARFVLFRLGEYRAVLLLFLAIYHH